MNLPAKRFSLSRLLAPTADRPAAPEPALAAPKPVAKAVEPASAPAASPLAAIAPSPEEPFRKPQAPLAVVVAPSSEDRHPKKKRSYSVDMKLCEDLELLAWYQDRSSSSVVEDLMRRYLSQHRLLVDKAREVKAAR